MPMFGESVVAVGRQCFLLAGLVSVLTGSGCKQCLDSPGLCPPMETCVDGFRRTGAASCDNGGWVCERVACVVDASACDGHCVDAR